MKKFETDIKLKIKENARQYLQKHFHAQIEGFGDSKDSAENHMMSILIDVQKK